MGTLKISTRSTNPDSLTAHNPPKPLICTGITFAYATALVAESVLESNSVEHAGETIIDWAEEAGEADSKTVKIKITGDDWEDTYEWSAGDAG